jgi:hypothetical protein
MSKIDKILNHSKGRRLGFETGTLPSLESKTSSPVQVLHQLNCWREGFKTFL